MDVQKAALDVVETNLSSSEISQLEKFGDKVAGTGSNFSVFNAAGDEVVFSDGGKFESDRQQLIRYSREAFARADKEAETKETAIYHFGQNNSVTAAVLRGPRQRSVSLLIDSTGSGLEKEFSRQLLAVFVEGFESMCNCAEQTEQVSMQLSQVYEELSLLYKLSTNMKIGRSCGNFLQMACDNLINVIEVEGIAVLLEKNIGDDRHLVLVAGSGLIDVDEHTSVMLKERLIEEIRAGREALLDSEVDGSFSYDWPRGIGSIITVPLRGKDSLLDRFSESDAAGNSIVGLLVAVNRTGKPDFDGADAELFISVANGCSVFVENRRLFNDLEELLIGSLRALTNSIDAKDEDTRGHSERVALISRWIAEQLRDTGKLDYDEINKIYLAGLLHDIGKVGVHDSVLGKEDKLTEQEMDCMRRHPAIGAGILGEIRQMADIISGVLCHHERMDGNGYPHGLTGDRIPLMAKIIGLADSFDAMTSKRTYRKAMILEEALLEVERNLGTQFDEKVGRAFINSDVERLWQMMQTVVKKTYRRNSFEEYGAMAVGSIIK